MKRSLYFFIAGLIILNIFQTVVYAEDPKPGDNYNKTFSIGADPLGFILLGPSAQVEYSGLGAVGIYGSYQHVGFGYLAESYSNIDISGYAVNGGARYYLQYDRKFHDSMYIAADYTYMFMKAEDNYNEYIDLTANMIAAWFGRRWQWDILFLDLGGGITYTTSSTKMSNSFDEDDKKDLENAINGIGFSVEFLIGVAF